MIILSLLVLALVAVSLLVGVHVGPHGSITGGALSLVISVALFIYVVGQSRLASDALAWTVLAITFAASLAVLIWGGFSLRSYRRIAKPTRKLSRLFDREAIAITTIDPTGTVKVAGETWTAISESGPIAKGQKVFVTQVEGLKLWVIPEPSTDGPGNELPNRATVPAVQGDMHPSKES